ncbi:MAG: hypothetical protein IJF95_07955 [Erysipelotrichaceae bacterium]|nr:hypothetical protein [Erysipelotrichaceae bacterium]
MTNKIKFKYIFVILIVLACALFSKNIRYFITGDDDIVISTPTAFYFDLRNQGNGDLYEIDGLESKVFISVDRKYLNNDDTHIYVTGEYWNYPGKPMVKLNGKVIDNVKSSNTGYAGSVFSDHYYSKNYHFDVDERIIEGKTYTFYVRIGDVSKSVDVIFISE